MKKIHVGEYIVPRSLETISGSRVDIPSQYVTHIQFRRFASCPICNLHLDSFVKRHLDLLANGIQEIAVFHSTQEEMIKYGADIPFAMIADPTKILYKDFGVESSLLSVIHPASWASGIKGLIKFQRFPHESGQSHLGLPADFMVTRSGEVVAAKYGKHADDHWEVDDVIRFARQLAA